MFEDTVQFVVPCQHLHLVGAENNTYYCKDCYTFITEDELDARNTALMDAINDNLNYITVM